MSRLVFCILHAVLDILHVSLYYTSCITHLVLHILYYDFTGLIKIVSCGLTMKLK